MKEEYFKGFTNRCIRYYFYLNQGLSITNIFHNLVIAILGLYIVLHLTNPWDMVWFFIVCIPILTVVGYYNVHKILKVQEFLNLKFGSHYGIQTFNFVEGQYELLKEIRDMLKEKKL